MNPTIAELIAAANRRNLHWSLPSGESQCEFLTLSDGVCELTVHKTKTPLLSAVNARLATDKSLSGHLLKANGFPVAEKHLCSVLDENAYNFLRAHRELVVKPNSADRGIGVTASVKTREELSAAYRLARVHGQVLLERQVRGREYRLLVIGGEVRAVLERKPLSVRGDGATSIRQLIDRLNEDPRRGPPSTHALMRPVRVKGLIPRLKARGYELQQVLEKDLILILSEANHLDSGGISCDRTEEAHGDYIRIAVQAAKLFSIDVAGIDLICPDISAPLEKEAAAILEVNPGPDLRWHLYPAEGSPRPVADDFISWLFPQKTPDSPQV